MSTQEVTSQQLLAALQKAVSAALERKRRLGHYAVVWENDRPLAVGEDAPAGPTVMRAAEPVPPLKRPAG